MGWRGTLRSAVAQQRRVNHERARRERVVTTGAERVDRLVASFESEIAREMERVRRYEESVRDKPISTLKLAYDREAGWATAPFGDQTGKVTYTLNVKLPTYDVVFEPTAIDVDGLTMWPLAASAADYGTFVAFVVKAEKDVNLKLTNRSRPDQGRIAIVTTDGVSAFAIESSLEGRIFAGTTKEGVVAFPPFRAAAEAFDLVVAGSGKKSTSVRLRVSGETLSEHMATCLAEPSISARFEAQMRSEQAKMQQKAEETRAALKKAGSGCVVVLVASALALWGSVAAFAWAFGR